MRPIDGNGQNGRLNAELVPGRQVGFYAFSPDGSRVLFAANQIQASQLDLFMSFPTPPCRRAR